MENNRSFRKRGREGERREREMAKGGGERREKGEKGEKGVTLGEFGGDRAVEVGQLVAPLGNCVVLLGLVRSPERKGGTKKRTGLGGFFLKYEMGE